MEDMRRLFKLLQVARLPAAGDWGMLILRVVFGFFMIGGHGWRKMMRFSDIAPDFYNLFGIGGPASLTLAVFAEVICAALVIIGLGTRLAVVPLIITMLVAILLVKSGDPIWDRETALLYLSVFVVILWMGPGRYSFDKVIFGNPN